jgi:hypothetical protein
MCNCIGNKECPVCYLAMTTAFDKQYQALKSIGMEGCLEAKEFMWEFYAARDSENIEKAANDQAGDGDPSQWEY